MAAEHATMAINGHFDPHGSQFPGSAESHLSSQPHHNTANASVPAPDSFGSQNANVSSSSGQAITENNKHTEIPKDQVGWHFVEQYYLNLSRSPSKLHLFYYKRSQFVWGVEAEKVEVSVGRTSISERIKELEFQDCKVRVSNVDSQASGNNILIQVIGEMSNKSAPHRKFVQTFILAEQPNGYFVLNDIFRYINDEEEGDGEFDGLHEPATGIDDVNVPAAEVEPKALTSSANPAEQQHDADIVVRQLEQKVLRKGIIHDDQERSLASETKTNGIVHHADESVGAAGSLKGDSDVPSPETAESAVAQEIEQAEKPLEPVPTRVTSPKPKAPAAAAAVAPAPAVPAKPAAPKTWAKLVATSASSAPSIPSSTSTASLATASSKAPLSSEKAVQRSENASSPAPPGGSAGWQTAGHDHGKRQNRPQSVSGVGDKDNVLAYVRNVTDKISADGLKAALQSFGELAYYDVSRQKNCAFVEFATTAGYAAAIAANPLSVGGEQVVVEERRPRSGAYGGAPYNASRGGSAVGRGRGNGDGRPINQGRGGYQKDGARGGAYGPPRGRGGNVTPRGGRGGAQAS